jgi:quercetin dioxygenase-like cupin family protein
MKQFLRITIMALIFAQCGSPQGSLVNLKNRKMNNISALHEANKEVSAKPVFKGTDATVTALQIVKNGHLKEHTTKVEAFLICVSGEVVFENEKGYKQTLTVGDYIKIEPMVKHWVSGIQDSQLLLIK